MNNVFLYILREEGGWKSSRWRRVPTAGHRRGCGEGTYISDRGALHPKGEFLLFFIGDARSLNLFFVLFFFPELAHCIQQRTVLSAFLARKTVDLAASGWVSLV